jgi:ribonuclease PH
LVPIMGIMSVIEPVVEAELYRSSGRGAHQARELRLTPGFVATAEGSVLIEVGHTRVLCNATIENGVPGWMRNSGRGWVTAEYGMLPRATLTRSPREAEKGKMVAAPTRFSASSGAACAVSST